MATLEVFFKNPYDDNYITDARLDKHTLLTLGLLEAANTDGSLTPLITTIESAYAPFHISQTGKKDESSEQKAFTLTTDRVIESFRIKVKALHHIVSGIFQQQPDTLLLFFPRGLSEFTKANKTTIEPLMEHLLHQCESHKEDIGEKPTSDMKQLLDDYRLARRTQVGQFGEVNTLRKKNSAERAALEIQLICAIHQIALKHPGDASACMHYFDQTTIQRFRNNKTENITPAPPSGGGQA